MWDEDFSKVPTSNLYQVGVPRQYVGKKYSKFFDFLTTKRSMIPLGLYRRQKVDMDLFMEEESMKNKTKKKPPGGNNSSANEDERQEVKYVLTNPLKHVKLKLDDLVFVLA